MLVKNNNKLILPKKTNATKKANHITVIGVILISLFVFLPTPRTALIASFIKILTDLKTLQRTS